MSNKISIFVKTCKIKLTFITFCMSILRLELLKNTPNIISICKILFNSKFFRFFALANSSDSVICANMAVETIYYTN